MCPYKIPPFPLIITKQKKTACPDGQAAFVNSSAAELQRRLLQVSFMRHFRAKQNRAQFLLKTAQQEFEMFMTHSDSVAVHSEFLLSLLGYALRSDAIIHHSRWDVKKLVV
jgi:hypothetical protein